MLGIERRCRPTSARSGDRDGGSDRSRTLRGRASQAALAGSGVLVGEAGAGPGVCAAVRCSGGDSVLRAASRQGAGGAGRKAWWKPTRPMCCYRRAAVRAGTDHVRAGRRWSRGLGPSTIGEPAGRSRKPSAQANPGNPTA